MSGTEFVPHPVAPEQAPPGPPTDVEEQLPAPVPGRAPRLWLRSLQSRLVFGVASLVLVLVIAIGACTYFALKSFLASRLDQQLQSTASGSLNSLFNGSPVNGPALRAAEVWA